MNKLGRGLILLAAIGLAAGFGLARQARAADSAATAPGQARPTYVVGVEDIDYLPAYSAKGGDYRGYARALLDAFAKDSGITFRYRPVPVPRLFAIFLRGDVDFKFPDNPHWQEDLRQGRSIIYSDPVCAFIDGVMVRPAAKGRGAGAIRTLGTVSGFTPWAWEGRIAQGKTRLVENTSSTGLINQVIEGRIDGAYASVAVVNYQLDHVLKRPGALVFDPSLPYGRGAYRLSTIRHPELIARFNAWMAAHAAEVAALKARFAVEKGITP